jgi:DNA-binding response OmpR family regulator
MTLIDKNILIVDDETDICSLITMVLNLEGCRTYSSNNLAEARKELELRAFDAILTDIRLPDGDGVEFVRQIKQRLGDSTPALIVTTGFSHFTQEEILASGADEFVEKPFDVDSLIRSIKSAMNTAMSRRLAG